MAHKPKVDIDKKVSDKSKKKPLSHEELSGVGGGVANTGPGGGSKATGSGRQRDEIPG
jgi:hypothetical protein